MLERKFGRPYLIVDAQLEMLRKHQPIKTHEMLISNFGNVLKQYIKRLRFAVKLKTSPCDRKTAHKSQLKWLFYVDDCHEDTLDLIFLEHWIGRIAFEQERFSLFK